jgi:predicted PurR-regulated permease PerM
LPDGAGRPLTIAVCVLAAYATVFTLQAAAPVLLPLVIAVLLFYALDPLVERLERWHVPRGAGALMVTLALVGGVGSAGWALWPQIYEVVDEIPKGVTALRREIRVARSGDNKSTLQRMQEAAKAIDAAAAEAASPTPRTPGVTRVEVQQPWRVSDWLWTGSAGVIGLGGQLLTILFLTVFLLSEGDSFKRKLVRHVESRGSRRVTITILRDIETQIETFIKVQALTSAIVGVATGLALWGMGVRQPAVWGIFAGVLNVVPYFGPLIVSGVLGTVGLLQFGSIGGAALVAGVTLAITAAEGLILTPHLLSRASSLNHVAIFTAIAFWSWAWGTPGMLLAVPLLMVCKAICDHVDGLEAVADLLGTGHESSPEIVARAALRRANSA